MSPQRDSGETKAAQQTCSPEGLKDRAAQLTMDPRGGDLPALASVSSLRILAGMGRSPDRGHVWEGPPRSCFPCSPCPTQARDSSFYTGQILTTPWFLQLQPLLIQAQAGPVCELLTPPNLPLYPAGSGGKGVGRGHRIAGFPGLDDGAGIGVGMGQTQGGRVSHHIEEKK